MILEVLSFAGPARGPEVQSQRRYSTGTTIERLGSFEPYIFNTIGSNEKIEVLCSRIYVNKSPQKKSSLPKVIVR